MLRIPLRTCGEEREEEEGINSHRRRRRNTKGDEIKTSRETRRQEMECSRGSTNHRSHIDSRYRQ
jgi:hypothetical protein